MQNFFEIVALLGYLDLAKAKSEALVRTFKKRLSAVKFSEPAINCLKIINLKNTQLVVHLSPRYSHVTLASGYPVLAPVICS